MPIFTKLEDPQPPDWSAFSKLNKAKEREVPLKMHQSEDSSENQRGRERLKKSGSPGSSPATPSSSARSGASPRSNSASKTKNSVRFDLDDDPKESSTRKESTTRKSSTTSEKRSSSVETFTRKTTSTTSNISKPPTIPKKTTNSNLAGNSNSQRSTPWRTASAERPSSAMAMSPNTERTLQEIDRDINQIWRELQELEKLPNGTYKPRSGNPAHSNKNNTTNVPVTPVKIKASYVPSASTPQKYSTSLDNKSMTSSYDRQMTSSYDRPMTSLDRPMTSLSNHGTPSSQRRTIWDMETPSSRPVTPQFSQKIDLPSPKRNASPAAVASAASTAAMTSSRPPPPPIPPHLRPQNIKMAPIARDESFYDLGASKSPSTASCYDNNEYSPASGKFKGFPYIDGAPRKRQEESPGATRKNNNNFALLVDKSTQTFGTSVPESPVSDLNNGGSNGLEAEGSTNHPLVPVDKQRKNKDACAIL